MPRTIQLCRHAQHDFFANHTVSLYQHSAPTMCPAVFYLERVHLWASLPSPERLLLLLLLMLQCRTLPFDRLFLFLSISLSPKVYNIPPADIRPLEFTMWTSVPGSDPKPQTQTPTLSLTLTTAPGLHTGERLR